jgi:hypothetical protein
VPSTATLFAVRTSFALKNMPSRIGPRSDERQVGSTPSTLVDQFWLP